MVKVAVAVLSPAVATKVWIPSENSVVETVQMPAAETATELAAAPSMLTSTELDGAPVPRIGAVATTPT